MAERKPVPPHPLLPLATPWSYSQGLHPGAELEAGPPTQARDLTAKEMCAL